MSGKLSKVPRFKLNNGDKIHQPGKNAFNAWRKLYPQSNGNAPVIPNNIQDTQLPWMSLYKDYKDLLKIDLVTTVGYVEDANNNNKWSAEFIRGFPLLLQGPSSQFNPINGQSQINSDPNINWERGWSKYYEHVQDFSGNLQANNISDFFDGDNKLVITDFNNDERRNLLILDFDDDGDNNGFYLHPEKSSLFSKKRFTNESDAKIIHKKMRPKYLVVRLDQAIEESTFNGNSEWGLVTTNPNFWSPSDTNKNKLYVFNYVYSGYVISPYDFMANFTADYLRGLSSTTISESNYFINVDDNSLGLDRPGQETIQLIKNNGDIEIKNSGIFDLKTSKAHNKLIAPFRYNFHLFPNALEIKGLDTLVPVNGVLNQLILPPANSSQPIYPNATPGVKQVDNRMNTIDFKLDNDLYSRYDAGHEYYIENIIWTSLSSARHTLYANGWENKTRNKNYIGNYLNINELTYNSNGELAPPNQNPDFAPKFGTASGVVIRKHNLDAEVNTNGAYNSSDLMVGLNEINMPRKTLTPYYKVQTDDAGEPYSYAKYAFNWNDTSKSWTDAGTQGIDNRTIKIDVSNHIVVEYRNLVRLKTDIKIIYKFFNDSNGNYPKTTFLPANKSWLNNTQLSNNDVQYVANSSGALIDEEGTRLLNTIITSGEYFEISWNRDNGNVAANTKKYGYLLDTASGRHEIDTSNIFFSATQPSPDTFIATASDSAVTNREKEKYKIISNVFQIRLAEVKKLKETSETLINNNIDLLDEGINTLNFSLDSNGSKVALYKVPTELEDGGFKNEKFPFFGYLNFIGINNSELIGNCADYLAIKTVFKSGKNIANLGSLRVETRNPYFKISNLTSVEDDYQYDFPPSFQTSFNMYYNPNLFYARSNFVFSNVVVEKNNPQSITTSGSEILFLNASSSVLWKNNSDGLDITNISSNQLQTEGGVVLDNTKGIEFYVYPSNVELFIPSLIGKVSTDNRTFNTEPETPSVLINNNLTINAIVNVNGETISIKPNCFQYDIINFCASQSNRFIPDYWKWSRSLIQSRVPPLIYNGPPDIIADRNLRNRYNVYNWNILSSDEQVDNSIYPVGTVHNPKFAFENQTLIHFNIEVSTITTNFSHILVNTWRGARNTNNKFQSTGIKSEANDAGIFEIVDNPVMKVEILGGNQINPSISDTAVILDVDPTAKFNYTTDTDTNDPEGKSKAPRNVPEGNGTIVDFTHTPFTENSTNRGWFAFTNFNPNKNGIFAFQNAQGTFEDKYQTNDLSVDLLELPPTNLTLKASNLVDDIKGTFSEEEQEFPFEFLFCYPIEDPPVPKPDGFTTIYNNSNNVITNTEFEDYKGFKRYSNLYAISLKGSNTGFGINNENFRDRNVFPNIIIINCVELPPPVQVNNTSDMVADDNRSVKIVWKGYNFSKPQGDFRSKYGNSGDIVWTITREQTQLGIRKKLFEQIIEPDQNPNGGDNYNLSTYTFIDTDVRIYDKYIYTVSGTFVYNFKRTSVDLNSTTLSLAFGSFITPEVIICKNNKFEFGRYNTTSTNLKLFRPLLLNKEGGQKDANGNQSAGGLCLGNIFAGSTNISSSQNIYANTSNQLTKKQTYVLFSKQQYRPFR